jgi:hypothetical protein
MTEGNPGGLRPHIAPSQPAPGFEDLESKPHDLMEDRTAAGRVS